MSYLRIPCAYRPATAFLTGLTASPPSRLRCTSPHRASPSLRPSEIGTSGTGGTNELDRITLSAPTALPPPHCADPSTPLPRRWRRPRPHTVTPAVARPIRN